jgi:hypothetical protein
MPLRKNTHQLVSCIHHEGQKVADTKCERLRNACCTKTAQQKAGTHTKSGRSLPGCHRRLTALAKSLRSLSVRPLACSRAFLASSSMLTGLGKASCFSRCASALRDCPSMYATSLRNWVRMFLCLCSSACSTQNHCLWFQDSCMSVLLVLFLAHPVRLPITGLHYTAQTTVSGSETAA